MRTILPLVAAALPLAGAPLTGAAAQDAVPTATLPGARLSDQDLARITGKFVLPNGVELALAVTSDTVVNGQLILRTVFTVDHDTQLQVFGRNQASPNTLYVTNGGGGGSAGQTPTGVTIAMDRQSGIQTVTPTFSVANGANVTVGGTTQSPEALGLVAVPVTPGGPALATADGTVSVSTTPGGSQVSFSGDRLAVANLVGQSIATALVNTANNRTLDNVTNISIDARNLAPYQVGAAQMRVEALVVDATRGMIR